MHVDAPVVEKLDALRGKQLVLRMRAAKGKARCQAPVLEDHAMAGHATGNAGARMHGKPYEARLARLSEHACNLSVAGNPSLGYLPHQVVDPLEEAVQGTLPSHSWALYQHGLMKKRGALQVRPIGQLPSAILGRMLVHALEGESIGALEEIREHTFA